MNDPSTDLLYQVDTTNIVRPKSACPHVLGTTRYFMAGSPGFIFGPRWDHGGDLKGGFQEGQEGELVQFFKP